MGLARPEDSHRKQVGGRPHWPSTPGWCTDGKLGSSEHGAGEAGEEGATGLPCAKLGSG